MMLKRSHKLQPSNEKPSKDFLQSRYSKFFEEKDIKKLFEYPRREVFQLSYLYSSPLCRTYPAYMEILKILENFNADTLAIESSQSGHQNPLRNSCIRFLYREMLSIAVMDQSEILINDYATKLKNWFFELSQKRSFLSGINFKKKKIDDQLLQELVRQSYVSNVFDEIDDYMRKKLGYQEEPVQKENSLTDKRKKVDNSQLINLPMLDIRLYKRQQQFLRGRRQRQMDSKYFHDIKANKSKMRQISLNNIRNRLFKENIAKIDEKMRSTKFGSTFHTNFNDLKNERINKSSKSLLGGMDMLDHIDWRRKPSQIPDMIEEKREKNRMALININGINLIHSKYE